MIPSACGLGQHFQARGHKPANNIFLFFPTVNWLTNGFVYVPSTNYSYNLTSERACIKLRY